MNESMLRSEHETRDARRANAEQAISWAVDAVGESLLPPGTVARPFEPFEVAQYAALGLQAALAFHGLRTSRDRGEVGASVFEVEHERGAEPRVWLNIVHVNRRDVPTDDDGEAWALTPAQATAMAGRVIALPRSPSIDELDEIAREVRRG